MGAYQFPLPYHLGDRLFFSAENGIDLSGYTFPHVLYRTPGYDKKADDTALLLYSDFYYPDETGTARKTILCREVRVEI